MLDSPAALSQIVTRLLSTHLTSLRNLFQKKGFHCTVIARFVLSSLRLLVFHLKNIAVHCVQLGSYPFSNSELLKEGTSLEGCLKGLRPVRLMST
jgi:hypothetical protein